MRRAWGSLLLLTTVVAHSLATAQNKRSARPTTRAKPAAVAPKVSRPEPPKPTRTDPASDRAAAASDDPLANDDRQNSPREGRDAARTTGPTAGTRSPLEAPKATGLDGGMRSSPLDTPKGTGFDGGTRSSPLNPRPDEFADAGPPMTSAELETVMGDIAALRGRIAAVSDILFKSRLLVRLETRGDHTPIARLTVLLDEGLVYTAPSGFSADEPATVYDHAVAPGKHVLNLSVERRDDRGSGFRAAQESRFVLEVPENQRLEAVVRLADDSDMGAEFPTGQNGTYDLRVRLRARAYR